MTDAKKTQNSHVAVEPVELPWWRYPIVWMVIGGPFAVVVAGLTTAVIAYRHIDPVLDTSVSTSVSTTISARASLQPALSGRNLAADHAVQSAAIRGDDHK